MAPKRARDDHNQMTEDEFERFLALVQGNPPLYDKSLASYKDLDFTNNIWISIHTAMNIDGTSGIFLQLQAPSRQF